MFEKNQRLLWFRLCCPEGIVSLTLIATTIKKYYSAFCIGVPAVPKEKNNQDNESVGEMHSPRLPSFFLIGAMKAGTTALDAYLSQHPQIYMCPVKDGRFFWTDGENAPRFSDPFADQFRNGGILGFENYRSLFVVARSDQILGESTALYLSSPFAGQRIKERVPNAKIIILLRQPATRSYAHYLQAVRNGMEHLDFVSALEAESWRIESGWGPTYHYIKRSFYVPQVNEYIKLFGADNIAFFLQEDLHRQPERTIHAICEFIGAAKPDHLDFSVRHNVTRSPRYRRLSWLINRPDNLAIKALRDHLPAGIRKTLGAWNRNLLLADPPALERKLYDSLTDLFSQDILALEQIIHRDLKHWLVKSNAR